MSSTRFFVGNIPTGTTEADLFTEFGYYGVVKKVELKTKNESELFAFVNIEIEDKLVEKCIREFSNQQFKGNYLNVSRAKESFLERLKREREESMNKASEVQTQSNYNRDDYYQESYKPLPVIQKEVQSEEESSESEDEDSKPELSTRELQVIQAAKSFKHFDPTGLTKAEIDDKKRMESLKKLKDRHQEQKNAIKNALALSTGPRSNKIVFEPPEPIEVDETSSKAQLFDEEDEEEESEISNFKVKKQFAGKNGAKMLELQSKFQGDDRFQIDERFADENDGVIDSRKKYTREELKERKKVRKEMLNWDQDEMKEERDHQLSILEGITGQSTGLLRSQNKPNLDRKEMTRFDPKKEDHKKYLDIVRGDEDVEDMEIDNNDKNENFEVSEEKFYEVKGNLANAFQSTSKPFSIFDMLGVSHDDPIEEEVKKEEEQPKLLTKLPMFHVNQMRFQYDSSDTDEEDEKRKQIVKKKLPKDNQKLKGGKYSKSGVFRYNLFYADNDPRLKEGFNFLKIVADPKQESFEKTRKNLKTMIKLKVRKAKQDQRKSEKKNFKKRKIQN